MALVAYNNTVKSEVSEQILSESLGRAFNSMLNPKEFRRFDYRIDFTMTSHPKYVKRADNLMFDLFSERFGDCSPEEIQSGYCGISAFMYQLYLSSIDCREIQELKNYLEYHEDDDEYNPPKYENVYSVMHSQFVEATMMLI